MVSKLFVSAFVLMSAVGVSFSTFMADKDADQNPMDEIKKLLSMLEHIDVDQMINNDRMMSNNLKCFMDEGPCTPQFREMKKMMPMLVKDCCSSCNKEQKYMIKRAIESMKARRPKEYERISKCYDPEGVYEKKFLEHFHHHSK